MFCVACTKFAVFPFSSWLPLAMFAPTPVSALVHSSTLVTAGLFLLCRSSVSCSSFLFPCIVFGVFTVVASVYGVVVVDLKKLIAYSTLSQISLVLCALS